MNEISRRTFLNDAAKAGLVLTHREPVPPFVYLLVFGLDPNQKT